MTNGQILQNVMVKASALASEARNNLDSPLAERLTLCSTSVAIVCNDQPRARVVVQAPDGHARVIGQFKGAEFPPALGVALSELLQDGLKRLSPKAQAHVVTLQAQGHSLGVIIELDCSSVHITLGRDGVDPLFLATLMAQETNH